MLYLVRPWTDRAVLGAQICPEASRSASLECKSWATFAVMIRERSYRRWRTLGWSLVKYEK